jgi:hypothetical protein
MLCTWTGAQAVPPGYWRIWISTASEIGGELLFHKQLATYVVDNLLTINITGVTSKLGAALLFSDMPANTICRFQMDHISGTGMISNSSQTIEVVKT